MLKSPRAYGMLIVSEYIFPLQERGTEMKRFAALTLAVLLLVASLTGCGGAAESFEDQVRSGNYSKAIEIYNKSFSGNSEAENTAKDFLRDFLDESWEAYVNGTIADQEFVNRYTTVEKVNGVVWAVTSLAAVHEQYLYVKSSKESYQSAVKYASEGDLPAAIGAYSRVVEEDLENFAKAQEELAAVTETYQDQIIANARQLKDAGNFDEAVTCVQQAEIVVGSTPKLEDCLSELYTQKYTTAIDDAADAGDDVAVIRTYVEAMANAYVVVSPDMTGKYSASVTRFLKDADDRAEDAFGGAKKDYSAAIRILQEAASQVSFDGELIAQLEQKIAYYQEYVPVPLTSLEYTQKARYIQVGDLFGDTDISKDVNGKLYDENTVILPTGGSLNTEVAASDNEAYVLYNLNFAYSTLKATVYRPYGSLSYNGDWGDGAYVKIYGDDVLLYESPRVTGNTYSSFDIELDITGVRNLKIVVRGVWTESTGWVGMYNRNPEICLAEVTLQK